MIPELDLLGQVWTVLGVDRIPAAATREHISRGTCGQPRESLRMRSDSADRGWRAFARRCGSGAGDMTTFRTETSRGDAVEIPSSAKSRRCAEAGTVRGVT